MPSNPRMPFWLDLLRTLHPPRGVMLVGAGDGSSAWLKRLMHWEAAHVTLVEGDETQFERLHDRVTDHHGWHLVQQVVAAEAGNVTYHHASLAIESGLVEPESLRPLWPHLTTRTSRTHRATTLDLLMGESDRPANWLVLDCLPALPLLQGAADHLQDIEVIAARVLLGADPLASGPAGQAPLQAWLEARGFKLLDTASGRHPAIGHALFVRDSQARLRALTDRLAEADRSQHEVTRQLATALTASTCQAEEIRAQTDEIARLTHELEAADTLARDQRHQLDKLQQACAQAATDAATVERNHADEIARLVKVQEAADTLARDQQLQLEQMQQARAQAATDAAALSQAHADEKARLAKALDAAEKLAADRHRLITQLRQTAAQTHTETAAQSRAHAEEVARLAQALEAAEHLARDRQHQLEQVQRACTQAAVDAATLTRTHADEIARLAQALEAAEKLAADRHRLITQLRQAAAQAEATATSQSRTQAEEIARLSQAQEAADKLAADRHRIITQLRQAAAQTQAETTAQSRAHAEEIARLAQALEASETRARDLQQQLDQAQQDLHASRSRRGDPRPGTRRRGDPPCRRDRPPGPGTGGGRETGRGSPPHHHPVAPGRDPDRQPSEAAAAAQSRAHAEEIASLVQASKEAEQQQTSAVQRQQELARQLDKQNQARAAAEKLVTDLRAQSQQEASRPRAMPTSTT